MRTIGSVLAALVVVGSFVGFLALHAVTSRVATETYFANVMRSSDMYRRLYDELLVDPEFAPQVDALLGGVNVKRDQVIATVKQLVPPELLEKITNTVISHLVIHFGSDAKLDLAFDITSIVKGIHKLALDAVARGLAAIPVREAPSYEAFTDELDKLIAALQGDGELPTAIPHAPIPEDQRAAVVAKLVEAGRLDRERPEQAAVIAAVEQALARDDVAGAIRAVAGSLLERLIARSIEQVTHNPYVTQIDQPDGPHYLFGPGTEITDEVDGKLARIRQLNRAAGTGRIVTAILFVVGLLALMLIHRGDRRAALLWCGTSLVLAGAAAFITWTLVRDTADRELASVAATKTFPGSFRAILEDVFHASVADFTPGFWIPAAVFAAVGVILLGAGALTRR